ncbi:integral membrane protein [Streptomyces laurentii]|uniref:Integral membrane protein n=1 Tax=Streptomyces laurentii TaxID=39478 RepID=A0A160P4B4_STRLU|nr:integral membrane protein [Streptomyces laurentii]
MIVFLLVLVVVLGLLGTVHWYVWRRLVRDLTRPRSAARRVGTVVLVALPLTSVGALASGRGGAPFVMEQILAWPGFLWLALLLYVTLALVVTEPLRPLLRRALARKAAGTAEGAEAAQAPVPVTVPAGPAEAPTPVSAPVLAPADAESVTDATSPAPVTPAPATPAPDLSRRLFVNRVVSTSALAVAAGTVGYGTYGVLRGPRVKRVTVPLAKLPRAAHGYRVAVVSDIHLGPILGRAHTQRIVDTINATQPDLVAVVGDLVDGSVANLGPAAEPLARLTARDGAYFVTGNHEYFSGADAWVDHVRELGLHPLRNDRVEIGAGFDLAGVDDVAGESHGQGPDFAKALGDRDRARTAVLLAHQPIVIDDAVRHGVDLQLSGHTHGGQLWPGNLIAELANPTVAGLERYGDTQLYVTRGAGAWGPPVRVGAPSDITVVELASRQA